MESLKEKLQSPAFTLLMLFLVTVLVLSIGFEKGTFLLWLQKRHNPFGDLFFKYVTYLGEIFPYVIVGLVFLLVKFYHFLLLIITGLSQYVIVRIAKVFVFDIPRPKDFFAERGLTFEFIEGVKVQAAHSFPSGHTATAFALATLLICLTNNKLLQVIYMLLAIMVAVSRIYLLQHFVIDTLGGALFGTLIAGFIWWYFDRRNPELLAHQTKLQGGLISK